MDKTLPIFAPLLYSISESVSYATGTNPAIKS